MKMLSKHRHALVARAALVAGAALLLDQGTKASVRALLAPCTRPAGSACEHVYVAGKTGLLRVENAGSALGLGQGMWVWILMAAAGLLLTLALPRWGRITPTMALGCGFLFGGAFSNLFDRLARGSVTDFIAIAWVPPAGVILNMADLALGAGAALATWILWRSQFGSGEQRRTSSESTGSIAERVASL